MGLGVGLSWDRSQDCHNAPSVLLHLLVSPFEMRRMTEIISAHTCPSVATNPQLLLCPLHDMTHGTSCRSALWRR